jgi:hypothetical protein
MVVLELAGDTPLPRDLAAGGVFVPDCALRLAEECDLVVCGASHQLTIPARVVYVDPRGGAGLELLGFSPEMKAQLVGLATPGAGSGEVAALAGEAPHEAHASADDLAVPGALDALDALEAGDDGEDDAPALIRSLPEDRDDDLAIPLSDHDDDAAPIVEEPAPSGDAVFSYGKPGLAYRGGVVRRAQADGAGTGDEADFAGAVGAQLDAELGLADLADVEGDEPANEPANDAPASLELDLIGLVARDGSPLVADPGSDADRAATEQAYADDAARLRDDDNAYRDEAGDEEDDPEGPDDPANAGRGRTGRARFARNVNERLRGLTLAAQVKIATQGELHERIILERLYGKNVWETLLRNPRLTAPEVSRIARYGSLPRVLLEIIVGNNAWLQIPEVRRALLSNPRLAVDQVMKVLRLTPKHELKLAAIQTAYPHAVRNAAKILMRGEP